MGWPIGHSLSPRVHNYWLKHYGCDGSYEALAVPPEKLAESLRALSGQGFRGVSLTIPHKEKALDIVDHIEPLAKRIGAINTIVVQEEGVLEGRNTDVYGFTQNLLASGVNMKNKVATILGAGGGARAVIVALLDMGVHEIHLINRTEQKAEDLARQLGGVIKVTAWRDYKTALKKAELLVNTTPLGMQGQPALDVSLENLPRSAAVTDIVYAPLTTPLLKEARLRGHKAIDGLGMLLYQAQPAFAAWFGKTPEVTTALRNHVLGDQ